MTIHLLHNMVYSKLENIVKIQFLTDELLATSESGLEYKVKLIEVMLIEK